MDDKLLTSHGEPQQFSDLATAVHAARVELAAAIEAITKVLETVAVSKIEKHAQCFPRSEILEYRVRLKEALESFYFWDQLTFLLQLIYCTPLLICSHLLVHRLCCRFQMLVE